MLAVIRQSHGGIKACLRMDVATCSGWFDVGQGFLHGCNLAPLLFNVFFAAKIMVTFDEFRRDKEVMVDMIKARRKVWEEKNNPLVEAANVICGTLSADDAGTVSQSPGNLEKTMSIIVLVAGRFGLVVSEPQDGDHVHAGERDGGAFDHGQHRQDGFQPNEAVLCTSRERSARTGVSRMR